MKALIRPAVSLFVVLTVVTGVVYNLLLRGVELPQGTTVEWSNEVLHVVACAYIVLDWFIAPAALRPVSASTRQVRPGLTVWTSGLTAYVPARIAAISASTDSRVRS